MGRAVLSKSLIQFSVDGWGCVPSLLFDLRPNYGGGNEDNGELLQKVPCTHSHTQFPRPCSRLLPIDTSARDSWALPGKSGSVSCGVMLLSPGFWWAQGFACSLQESVSPVLWKLCNRIPLVFKVKFPGGSQSLCQILRLGNLLWALELLQQYESFFCRINCSPVCGSSAQWLYGGADGDLFQEDLCHTLCLSDLL